MALGVGLCIIGGVASADTLRDALIASYNNNPTLNARRAEQRATDEGVPQARGSLRPRVSASGDYGISHTTVDPVRGPRTDSTTNPAGVAVTITQDIFRGFRTRNAIRSAESLVRAGRSSLLNEEQNTLLDAVEAYMNVVRDAAIVRLNVQNLAVLREQLRSTQNRFEVGEVTRTDVAQAEARVAEAVSLLLASEGTLKASEAVYRQVIGRAPRRLRFPGNLGVDIPRTLDAAVAEALSIHPAIRAAEFSVEAAEYDVKSITGELLPTVSIEGSASRRFEPSSTVDTTDSASIVGRVTVPIYQQGVVSSRVRQSKQIRTQRRLEADAIRDQVRAAVVSAWAGLETARGQIESDQAAIEAATLALEGVRQEELVGQRTTLDVLDAQQELLIASVNLTQSQRDRVVAVYSLSASTGQLNARNLGLPVRVYDPEVNYQAVRDKWFGLRTPGGN